MDPKIKNEFQPPNREPITKSAKWFILTFAVFLIIILGGISIDIFSLWSSSKESKNVVLPPTASIATSTSASTPVLGGDKDVHGCVGSAGYSWCEAKNKCLRIWEESCGANQ